MIARCGRSTRILGIAVLVVAGLGCAAAKPSADPWMTHYVGSPDDVWIALHIALVDLEYDVESENREDGKIRAVSEAEGDESSVVLTIDQVMRNNEVQVFVRVAAGPDEPAMGFAQREKHAKDLLALVNGVLYK
jgi:hypothetical protein